MKEKTIQLKNIEENTNVSELYEKISEIEKTRMKALTELSKLQSETKNAISDIAEKAGFFCGVVIDTQNLLEIVKIAIESKEKVQIPFQLYPKNNK